MNSLDLKIKKSYAPSLKKIAELKEFFSVGNIIYSAYWKRFDEVLAFEIDSHSQLWAAQVVEVRLIHGTWQRADMPHIRKAYPCKYERVVAKIGEETNQAFIMGCIKSLLSVSPCRQHSRFQTAEGCQLMPKRQRLKALTEYFGDLNFNVEFNVYKFMERICPDYEKGEWEYIRISSGGFYMAPKPLDSQLHIVTPNGFDGVVSQDAAGVIVMSYALCDLANRYEDELLIERYEQLCAWFRNYHPEYAEINLAIDSRVHSGLVTSC